MQTLDFPATTQSYRQHHLEAIAGDVKEAIGRVSDGPFDAEQNANIPTVNYEVGKFSELKLLVIACKQDESKQVACKGSSELQEGNTPCYARCSCRTGRRSRWARTASRSPKCSSSR